MAQLYLLPFRGRPSNFPQKRSGKKMEKRNIKSRHASWCLLFLAAAFLILDFHPEIYAESFRQGTADWDAYFRCGPKAPMLALTTSATGGTLDWTKASGAKGYYVRYKSVERGEHFEPQFEENHKIDVGDTNTFSIALSSGACFYHNSIY
jgi:hypothetical protein